MATISKPQMSVNKKKKDGENYRESIEREYDHGYKKSLIKPPDQLDLTETELKEEIARVLTTKNPNIPKNLVQFDYNEGCFKPIICPQKYETHFQVNGSFVAKDSEEGKKIILETPNSVESKKLFNRFNYTERGAQTINNLLLEKETITEPPPKVQFSGQVTQWGIFDVYLEEKLKNEKNKERKSIVTEEETGDNFALLNMQINDISSLSSSAKILERMVTNNIYDEILLDFRYWEHATDEFKDQEGSLLPLWKFSHWKTRKMTVTALSWNSKYSDLIEVGYGTYDIYNQGEGLILLFSLKNPSYPENIIETTCGVFCLQSSPTRPYIIAVGFFDGSIKVYDVRTKNNTPKYSSEISNKHIESIWKIQWLDEDSNGYINFASIGAEGKVILWTLVKNELRPSVLLTISRNEYQKNSFDNLNYDTLTYLEFSPHYPDVYLLANEYGGVYKCSKYFTDEYISFFNAHQMAIYSLAWNYFHPRIFVTCSADWSVKIWDYEKNMHIFSFDLNAPVSDVQWAPYSSTVFAACTTAGKIYVFDLAVNKYESLCSQQLVQRQKAKLTHLSFNPKFPIILVSDDRGYVISYKLSPNLRKVPKEKRGAKKMTDTEKTELEISKLDKIISTVG